MVNLIAQAKVVPELIQDEMTAENLAAETLALLESQDRRAAMLAGLQRVRQALRTGLDPFDVSASRISASMFASNSI
jgi:lipid-A-disaccharide synthase